MKRSKCVTLFFHPCPMNSRCIFDPLIHSMKLLTTMIAKDEHSRFSTFAVAQSCFGSLMSITKDGSFSKLIQDLEEFLFMKGTMYSKDLKEEFRKFSVVLQDMQNYDLIRRRLSTSKSLLFPLYRPSCVLSVQRCLKEHSERTVVNSLAAPYALRRREKLDKSPPLTRPLLK